MKLTESFFVRGIVLLSSVLNLRVFPPLPPPLPETLKVCSGEGETALLSSGEVCGEEFFLVAAVDRNSSLELTDFFV